jgi:glycine/D-amino acid oxidase-like deaminating enzyme/nitrite reductase/ring-hydroxylating ferredoxin subunit
MIARDGALHSVWQETTTEIKPIQASQETRFDVIIVGAGITGITTGLLLQSSGKKCLILESHSVGFGTTSGTTAHLNTLLDVPYTTIIKNFDVDKGKLVARATRDAIRLVKSNIRKYGIRCGFEMCDGYLLAEDEKQAKELREIHNACNSVGIHARYTKDVPATIPFVKAICVPQQAKFHPLRYVMALAEAFENEGGVIITNCRVTRAEEGDTVTVETENGSFTASHLIYATHIPPTVNLVHLRCAPYRSYVIACHLKGDGYPDDLIYDMADPYHYYRSQVIDGVNYLIAGGEDHRTGPTESAEASFRNLENHVRKNFEIESITQKWSSQYYEPADGLPYIGKMPGHADNVLVATGFGGNGMVYSGVSAKILSSLVLNEEDELTHAFSPSRIKPVAGFKNFVEHNFGVLKSLVDKLFASEEINGFADLAPGDGKVLTLDGQYLGIYKDDSGAIHVVNATCTHLKCTVGWNHAEKSWDCPCHGARFTMDGKVLNGPADRDLEYVNVEIVALP